MDAESAIYLETTLGLLRVRASAKAIVAVEFVDETDEGPEPSDLAMEAARQLAEYFTGVRRRFDLPLAPEGTAFQKRAWRELRAIPYGRRTTYGAIAERLGDGGAARAVGAATGANPLAIVVPCHRVVSATGALTGYSHGVARKKWLLVHESRVAAGDPYVTLDIGPSRRLTPRGPPSETAPAPRKRDRSIGEW
ncbi:MAG TPA: methylated-DNA--[protein]-cysteine S-methyltransferase [Candidatus Thermoplasmatota archaeon]|nr:methylated-DNA--[protein]-cysteine S-methyltransferase [Candidatus Thermoplasmatota archaeon]